MTIDILVLNAIKKYSALHSLPFQFVQAMVMQESGGNQWRWNPEPKYRYLVNAVTKAPFRRLTAAEIASEIPPADFPRCPGVGEDVDAEWWGQQASWGAMQVMGAVAREAGFKDSFTKLCDLETGIDSGCRHLRILAKRFQVQYGWQGVAAAYNTGQPESRTGAGLVYVTHLANKGAFDFV